MPIRMHNIYAHYLGTCVCLCLCTLVCLYTCTIYMHMGMCALHVAHDYLSTRVCLVHVHSRNVCCVWNGKCKVDNVLASVRF